MNPHDRNRLKTTIRNEITKTESAILSLTERSRPVPPDDAIGRLTRMEAIASKSVSEANLRQARARLKALENALRRIDSDPDFGVCEECEEIIPAGRLAIMPETRLCVRCAQALENR